MHQADKIPREEVVLESENIPENTPCLRKDEVMRERGVGGVNRRRVGNISHSAHKDVRVILVIVPFHL